MNNILATGVCIIGVIITVLLIITVHKLKIKVRKFIKNEK